MTDFGGSQEFTTWDGDPISRALEIPWGTPVAVDGTEHDRLEWVPYADARLRCRPAALAASFATACEACGFG